jgi:hypothetical protein
MKDTFETSGTSPAEIKPGVDVANHGSVFLLKSFLVQPFSTAASSLIRKNLPEDRTSFGCNCMRTEASQQYSRRQRSRWIGNRM